MGMGIFLGREKKMVFNQEIPGEMMEHWNLTRKIDGNWVFKHDLTNKVGIESWFLV